MTVMVLLPVLDLDDLLQELKEGGGGGGGGGWGGPGQAVQWNWVTAQELPVPGVTLQ